MILTTVTTLALGLFALYESFPRLTASSNRHHLTRTHLIQLIVDVTGLSKEINAALE